MSIQLNAKIMLTHVDTALLYESVNDTDNKENFPIQYSNLSKVSGLCTRFLLDMN